MLPCQLLGSPHPLLRRVCRKTARVEGSPDRQPRGRELNAVAVNQLKLVPSIYNRGNFRGAASAMSAETIPWIETPLIYSSHISARLGCSAYLKLEVRARPPELCEAHLSSNFMETGLKPSYRTYSRLNRSSTGVFHSDSKSPKHSMVLLCMFSLRQREMLASLPQSLRGHLASDAPFIFPLL